MNKVDRLDIDLSAMTDEVREESKEELKRLIEIKQARLITSLCSIEDGGGRAFYIAGSYSKGLVTRLGKIKFRVVKARVGLDGPSSSPILDVLVIRKRKYALDVRMLCADLASLTAFIYQEPHCFFFHFLLINNGNFPHS